MLLFSWSVPEANDVRDTVVILTFILNNLDRELLGPIVEDIQFWENPD
jgi:hypothetical protein